MFNTVVVRDIILILLCGMIMWQWRRIIRLVEDNKSIAASVNGVIRTQANDFNSLLIRINHIREQDIDRMEQHIRNYHEDSFAERVTDDDFFDALDELEPDNEEEN